jgi:hypothetical protein
MHECAARLPNCGIEGGGIGRGDEIECQPPFARATWAPRTTEASMTNLLRNYA